MKDLDTEFELRRVELKADHKARVAGAEAVYQKKLPGLFMNPGVEFTDQTVQQLQAEAKTFADARFELKKQSAEELQGELIANEERKNALLTEGDQMALDEASTLGLTDKYVPILATPIGDGLTRQEERWNDREKKEVVKLEERNRKTLSAFRNGGKLRQWEIEILNEDSISPGTRKPSSMRWSQSGFSTTPCSCRQPRGSRSTGRRSWRKWRSSTRRRSSSISSTGRSGIRTASRAERRKRRFREKD